MEMERKLTTIVAMDVAGYSTLMERDEEGTLERLKNFRSNIIDPAISRHGGRTFKLTGDGTLAEFASVVSALQCSIEIQSMIYSANEEVASPNKIQLRTGIHLGDVIVEGDDFYGDCVNIASRLESIAPVGGILLSKQVFDHIGNRSPVNIVSLGEQHVKNIIRPIEVYQVQFDNQSSSSQIIRFGVYEIHTGLFELHEDGEPVAVEPLVFNLITYLAENSDRTVTKDELFENIWRGRIVSDSALSSQVKAARRALGDDGAKQNVIRTVHGRGFRFVAPILSDQSPDENPSSNVSIAIAPDKAASKPCIAILPFVNLNMDKAENYFADGITEDIIIALSKNRWLTVVARNSSFSFRDSTDSIKSIGRQLSTNYIVTGSVRKAGTRVRVTIQVVDAETEESVWSERFDRDMIDIFELQDEITDVLSSRIESELGLSEQRKSARRQKKNMGAWDLYQLGVAKFYKFTHDDNLSCQDLLRQSLELDPEFASAHSRLAYAIVLSMVYFDVLPDTELLDEALEFAKKSIQLDEQDANGYFTLGRVHLARCEYDQAIEALEYALELNPCLAVTYCGLGDSLAYEGRLDEAIEQFDTAIRLSPHDPFRWAFYSYRSLAHLFREEFDDAVHWARKSLQIPNAQYWAQAHLVSALGHAGKLVQAEQALAQLKEMKPEFSIEFAHEHLFYLKSVDQIKIYMEGLKMAGLE
jgi:TolB-like protein/class 3 adenylate cyclase/lipoprotein NlpI